MVTRLILLTYVSLCVGGLNAILYDSVSGKPVKKTQLKIYEQRKNTGVCTVKVKPCDPKEWQRLDGSCHNLKYPSRGPHGTPTIRMLPLDFEPNYEPRKAADGGDLELPRRLRTELLTVGKASDLRITQLVTYFLLYSNSDINSLHDIFNYITNITYCCEPKGKDDYRCTPVKIPRYDPVHRFSGISCMNLTRPQSYQTYGCLDNGTDFVRIVFQTPMFDLSNIYNPAPRNIDHLRTFKNELLKTETDNGLIFPPSDPTEKNCFLNQHPKETRCNKYHANTAVGPTLFIILFYKHHNIIAQELHKLNPSWDDERLFYTARDINIAIFMQIFIYELMPIFLGKSNMIRDGIISCDGGFRDMYDKNIPPQMSDEYVYVLRWFHTAQETTMKLYDKDGCFLKTFPLVNVTARTGYYAVGENMLEIIQGSFRQPGGRFDNTIDYDMAERPLGGMLLSADLGAEDLQKGRFFGFQPYIKYKEFCTKRRYKTFSDLKHSFTKERLYRLKQNYKCVEDIDLMAGLWAEKHVKGGRVPETMSCLMTKQLKRSIAFSRHNYESRNRPHAFTKKQLKAIRKTTIAGFLCTVADCVTEIQPHAFYTISSKNPLTKCSSSKIGKLDLTPWKERKN